MIHINGQSWIVNGVMKDIKNSVITYADILLRMDNVRFFNPSLESPHYNNAGSSVIFVLEKPGADLRKREEEVASYFKEIFWIYERELLSKVRFIPLTDIYFSELETGGLVNSGDWTFVIVLISVGIMILLFAIINYINLTVAQTGFRAREMATRQLLGSSRMEIFLRLVAESVLLTFISFGIGVFLAFLFVPAANELLETSLDLPGMISPLVLFITFLILLGMGILAGLLPATIISATKPIDIVKGSFRTRTKMVFSKIFITFQKLITITLAALSITMIWQINHLIKAPLGYDIVNIIKVPVWSLSQANKHAFRNELSRLSSVEHVGLSNGDLLGSSENMTTVVNGNNVSFQWFTVDPEFLEVYGIHIIKENIIGETDAKYVSMQGIREMEISMDEKAVHASEGWTFPIAGIIEDVYLRNRMNHLQPILIEVKNREDLHRINYLSVKVHGDPLVAYNQIKEIYGKFTPRDFDGEFVDDIIARSFASQKRLMNIVVVFAFIAAVISMLGLLAMSTYFIQQRTREIAVRKVFGSTNSQILIKIVGMFLGYVGVAFLLSIGVIWYLGDKWLSVYSYRIPLSPVIFIGAGLICLLISFLTIYSQSRRAANANPALSIKAE